MNYLERIACRNIGRCCLVSLGLLMILPAAHASEKVALMNKQPNTNKYTKQLSAKQLHNKPNTLKNTKNVKRGAAKDLVKVQGIGLSQTPQFISQQSPSPTDPAPSPPDAQTPGQAPPESASPDTQTPGQAPSESSAPDNSQPPIIQNPSEPQLPSPEQVKPDPANVDPGRPTRSGSSYVGIGANVGGFGKSSVGSPGLMLYSKVGLTRYFSIRPAVVTDFSDDATFILPATFDFAPISIARTVAIAPYIGGGATVTTGGDVRPLLMGGVDVPITSRFTATFGVNTTFGDDTDLGGFVGVGYNFR